MKRMRTDISTEISFNSPEEYRAYMDSPPNSPPKSKLLILNMKVFIVYWLSFGTRMPPKGVYLTEQEALDAIKEMEKWAKHGVTYYYDEVYIEGDIQLVKPCEGIATQNFT